MPLSGTIVTDSMRTSRGKAFWNYRIVEAFQHNLFIYLADFNLNKIELIDKKDGDKIFEKGWGTTRKFEAIRIIISRKALKLGVN